MFRNLSDGWELATIIWLTVLSFGFMACTPLTIYFCSLELAKLYRWPVIAALWIALYALGITVWRMGRRKERLAQNPLQGLI